MCSLILVGCNGTSDQDSRFELEGLISANKHKWDNLEINTYTYTYANYPSDCPNVDIFPPVEITVENNVITQLYVPDLGTFLAVRDGSYPTIDEIFENMLSSIDSIENLPSFDESFGYPISYDVDLSSAECDGFTLSVSSFL
ncbi:DUF6174 domain-containing protein [Catenovulum sp. SX2]|uniref:DUF6174 domain-containing protein n=1 Tax=Catenovulum sp. SX2 TaxID=3398614 RepID=UPI003F8452CD